VTIRRCTHDVRAALDCRAALARRAPFAGRADGDCRADLAAALRTISRLRRGLLGAAERAALLRRLPRCAALPRVSAPGDALTPAAPRLYAVPAAGSGHRLDATG
jgi:hypothetical protein